MAYIDYVNLIITLAVIAAVLVTCRYVWRRYL